MQNPTKAGVTAQQVNMFSSILILQNNTHDETGCCHRWFGFSYFFLGKTRCDSPIPSPISESYSKL